VLQCREFGRGVGTQWVVVQLQRYVLKILVLRICKQTNLTSKVDALNKAKNQTEIRE